MKIILKKCHSRLIAAFAEILASGTVTYILYAFFTHSSELLLRSVFAVGILSFGSACTLFTFSNQPKEELTPWDSDNWKTNFSWLNKDVTIRLFLKLNVLYCLATLLFLAGFSL